MTVLKILNGNGGCNVRRCEKRINESSVKRESRGVGNEFGGRVLNDEGGCKEGANSLGQSY